MENDEYKAMSREEEIKQVAENYASQMCKNCAAMLYCEEKIKKCVERREQGKVFAAGAKWADEHPAKVWHQASEEPAGRDWRILCEDESGNCWVASRRDAFTIGYNWQEFAEDEALTRWAYISDLLPKQFGISEQLKGGE